MMSLSPRAVVALVTCVTNVPRHRGSGLQGAGDLLDVQHHELRRLQWREAYPDVDDAQVAVILRRCFRVAFDEIGILRRGALECTLAEQALHERSDIQADLRP